MRRSWVVAAGMVLAVAVCGGTAEEKKAEADNLLVNGGFEEGPEPGEFKPLDKDSTEIKGWKVTRAQIDYIGTYWKAAAGERSIDLHGSPGIGGVSQTFKTKKGQKYRVTFHIAANPDGSVAKKKVGVKAADKEMTFEFDGEGKSKEAMGWEKKTFEFTATGDETTLELFSAMTEDEACGPALDEVTVVPVKD